MSLTWQQFRVRREQILHERPDVRRLDVTDPCSMLARTGLVPTTSDRAQVDSERVARAWCQLVGVAASNMCLGTGVRDLLACLLPELLRDREQATVWLPTDAYPVYWRICEPFDCRGYATMKGLDLQCLAQSGANDVLLLPAPLVATGQWPTRAQLSGIRDWLIAAPERLLLCDTVYAYDCEFGCFAELLATDRCIIVNSLAKSWLLPGVFGMAFGSSRLASIDHTAARVSSAALHALHAHPDLPAKQQRLFDSAWTAIGDLLPKDMPWNRPAQGYYTTIATGWQDLLQQRNILSLPASIFGSNHSNLSVLSCLAQTP